MGRCFRYLSVLLFHGVIAGVIWGTTTPSYRHDLWNTSGGFPGGYVYSITQTADGYIWIGSSKGLIRYDGTAFMPVRVSDSNPEAKLPVWGLLTDLDDQLWVIDDHTHVFRYSSDRLLGPLPDNYRHRYRLSPLFTKTHEGRLLFGSEVQGLIEYRSGSSRVLLDPVAMPSLPTAIAETADGTFWIGTEAMGVFRVRLIQGAPEIQHVAALINAKINCLLPIGASTLLIGTGKGLWALHNGAVIQQVRSELRDQEIVALANGMRGDIWIGAEGRVFKASAADIGRDGQIRSLDRLDVSGTVTALFEDRDGDLWIGGPERLERYHDSGFISYLSSAGLPCVNCGAIYVDHHDRLWFAPWDGGLFRLSEGSIQRIEVAGLKDDTVYSIVGGADNEVWVGRKYGGVTRLILRANGLDASTYTQREGLSQDSVSSIYRAPDGTIWAGTVSGGLDRLSGGSWQTFTTRDGLPSNRITAITGNPAGEIFVGTSEGLATLKHNHWVVYAAHDGLPPGTIESLFADNSGTLWIGTIKGIAFLESGKVHVPLGAPKALYGEILGIAENEGWLWVTTRDRVLRVRRRALLKQLFDDTDYREFGMADGLPSSEGVKRSYSVVKDDSGRIWFSLNQGISLLRPAAFETPAFPVTVRFDDMLVDGRPLEPGGQMHVPPGRHRLTLGYAGVCVSNPAGLRYRYRLEGVDSTWSEPTTSREIDYTNIAPGRLRFEVIARNPDGIWNSEQSTMSFVVEPAYWQTIWFRVLCAAAFLALLWAAYRLRVLQLQEQEKKFREAVEAMPAMAFTSLPDGSRTFVNKRWVEFTGLTAEQAAASGSQAATHPDDLNRVIAKWRASLASGDPLEYESRLRRGVDREYRWFLTQAVPIRDQRGKIIKWCGTSIDIEDRKRSEELQVELAHVNRVTTMGELTASLAHEIKQPIGAAVMNAEVCLRLLNRNQPDVTDAREAALEMVKDARRAGDIIDRVRSLYQKGSLKLELVDANEVIAEMLILLRYEASRHSVKMRTDLGEELSPVMTDRVRLQQVLINLMINGIEAMRDNGGELCIKSQLTEDGRLLISVSDNGVGLPAEKADQIFNAFFTTKPQGTGLGLSITRSILESHGGRVWATANSGRGTTFHFTLPIGTAVSA
jgi:PAS domain S-box-containing protein